MFLPDPMREEFDQERSHFLCLRSVLGDVPGNAGTVEDSLQHCELNRFNGMAKTRAV